MWYIYINIVLGILASAAKQVKEIKWIRIGKEKMKLALLTDDVFLDL